MKRGNDGDARLIANASSNQGSAHAVGGVNNSSALIVLQVVYDDVRTLGGAVQRGVGWRKRKTRDKKCGAAK